MRWRLQYSIRSIMLLTAVAAAVFAWWRWYESNRWLRELEAQIRKDVKDNTTRELLCALVWQPKALPLLMEMGVGKAAIHPLIVCNSVNWEGSFAADDGTQRRIFMTDFFAMRGFIIVTDAKLNLLTWSKGPGTFESAGLTRETGHARLKVEGPRYGIQELSLTEDEPPKNWWIHRYNITDTDIEELPIEFVPYPAEKKQ